MLVSAPIFLLHLLLYYYRKKIAISNDRQLSKSMQFCHMVPESVSCEAEVSSSPFNFHYVV